MNSEIQDRLLAAVLALLLPIARMLLRYGITYRQFAAVAKMAFVREAFGESDARGRRTNASRVAVRTGISRKEVSRIRDMVEHEASEGHSRRVDHSGPPARVLHLWHSDPGYLKPDGSPMPLDFEGDEPSFSSLVRAVAGDVPPGAVRAELRKAGAISDTDTGQIIAAKRYYIPVDVDEKVITVFSSMMFPLAAGLDHNSNPERTADGFIQRVAFSERLATVQVPDFRNWSRAEATKFIESVNGWLAAHESAPDAVSLVDHTGNVSVGVFYYEGQTAEAAIGIKPT